MKRAPLGLVMMLIFVLFAAALNPLSLRAADGVPNIDAVLVLDASNSMNTSDPHKLSIEAMKMFIDMLSVQGDKVGVVSYTDQIEREKAMTAIRSAADKESLKDFISQLKRGAYTDITVGLDEALHIMDDAHEPMHKPVIIMLTDGNNELNPNNSKTLDDCASDTDRIVSEAQFKGYPIYTIGLNYDGYLNRQYIEDIAQKTGGLCFEATTADELPDILSAIFADQMEIRIVNAGLIQADGDFQSVEINIPDSNIVEANITILSGQPVELALHDPNGNPVPFDRSKAILTQSNTYSLLKVISPAQGPWMLSVKGVSGDKIKINLLYHYAIDILVNIQNLPPAAGETITAEVTLLEGGQPTGNIALYHNSTCGFILKDMDTQQESFVTAVYQNNVFTADIPIPDAHTYELSAKVEHQNFFRESSKYNFTALANAPAPTATPAPTPTVTQTPIPTVAPTPITTGEPANEPENKGLPLRLIIILGVLLILIIILLLVFLRLGKRSSRVFTGKLVIEITDNYTREKSAPQYRNLIEYGRKTTLSDLLSGAVSPSLSQVILTPSPDAPSHMPQLIVKCQNPQLKFRKDFMDQDASRGIPMTIKSELTVILEVENKSVKLRYTA